MRLRTAQRTTRSARAAARAGFTLMELLVVIAILLVLVGVATPLYLGHLERSKIQTAQAYTKLLASELKNFAVMNSEFPPPGDFSLLPLPPEKQPPVDPWGSPYQWDMRYIPMPDGTQVPDPVVWSVGPNRDQGPDGAISSVR